MQVILKEDVHNLGKAGELVNVKPGYGRNYLIPQGLALVASAGNIQQIEHEKKVIAAKTAKLHKDSQAAADKLSSIEVSIERQVGEESKLFGSVTTRDIAEALADKGIVVDHRKIVLPEPIKAIGFQTIDVKLGQGVVGKLKVVVVPRA